MLVAIYWDRDHPGSAYFDRDWFRRLSRGRSLTPWDQLELIGLFRLTGGTTFVDINDHVYKLVPEGGAESLFAQDVMVCPPEEMPGVDILFRIDYQREAIERSRGDEPDPGS